MRKSVLSMLVGLTVTGLALSPSSAPLLAQTADAPAVKDSAPESSYFQAAKRVEVRMPNHFTSNQTAKRQVGNVLAVTPQPDLEPATGMMNTQEIATRPGQPLVQEMAMPVNTPQMIDLQAIGGSSVESPKPMLTEQQLAKSSHALNNLDVNFKPLPNRLLQEAMQRTERERVEAVSQALEQRRTVRAVVSGSALQRQAADTRTTYANPNTANSENGRILDQQARLIEIQQNLLLSQAKLNRKQVEFAESQRIAGLQRNNPRSENEMASVIATAGPEQSESVLVEQTQLVQEVQAPQRVERPTMDQFSGGSDRGLTREPSGENGVVTYRWTGTPPASSSAGQGDDMQEVVQRYQMNPYESAATANSGSQMRDTLDHFRTEDSHINVRPGPYENRDPFGLDSKSCCDEWAGFCKMKKLDFDCGCGGLKAKPGHLGMKWLRSGDAAENCDFCNGGCCSKRGVGITMPKRKRCREENCNPGCGCQPTTGCNSCGK